MALLSSPSTSARGDGQTGPVPTLAIPRLQQSPGPESTVLVIGYPARAAVEIVERLLATDARTIACVVPPDQVPEATRMQRGAQDAGRLLLFEGAATTPGLGLPCTAWRILDTTDEIYGVASPDEIAAGHIQDFADECPRLRHVHLVPQGLAERDAHPSRAKRSAFQRIRGLLSARAPFRTSVSTLATGLALGVAGLALVAPFVLAIGPWKDMLDFDTETALSWEDLERDLWPGLQQGA